MTIEEAEKLKEDLKNKIVTQIGTDTTYVISKLDVIVNKTTQEYDLDIQLSDDNKGLIVIRKYKKFRELYTIN